MKNSCFWRNCFYDDNNDAKDNKNFDDLADNPDNQGWICFIELLRVLWVRSFEPYFKKCFCYMLAYRNLMLVAHILIRI